MGAVGPLVGPALRVQQQPLHSAGPTMLGPVLLHSAAGPLSAAASLPTPGQLAGIICGRKALTGQELPGAYPVAAA